MGDGGGPLPLAGKPLTIDLRLRSHQANYIARMAGRDDNTLSDTFAAIVETHAEIDPLSPHRKACKVRVHIVIRPHHLAILDALAMKWGVLRSDVARRLVDQAMALDGRV